MIEMRMNMGLFTQVSFDFSWSFYSNYFLSTGTVKLYVTKNTIE